MGRFVDRTGQQYGDWVVIRRAENSPTGRTRWLCECSCGVQVVVHGGNLQQGVSTRCRDCSDRARLTVQTGARYGKWIILGRADVESSEPYWACLCDCGNASIVKGGTLTSGNSTRCRGCSDADRRVSDERVTYALVHTRLQARRGSAAGQPCFGCGRAAHVWAYQHNGGVSEREEWRLGRGKQYLVPFSVNLDHYEPMCHSCHATLDRQKSKERASA